MKQAVEIITALEKAGYEAYIVGGAVRDSLLGRRPPDVDICTSALPEEIKGVASQCGWPTYAVGAAFGTIVVVCGTKQYEVTTFRSEAYGTDSHRPEQVIFSRSLEEDVRRRDFTVNGLCMNRQGQVIDLIDGQRDLQQQVLRTIGAAKQRFAEDGLRMFRAGRFVAKFNFTLDKELLEAIQENTSRVQGLSVERVRDELEKILVSPFPVKGLNLLLEGGLLEQYCRSKEGGKEELTAILPEVVLLKGLAQNPRHHKLDVWEHTLYVVKTVPACPVLRWAALLHDIAKGRPGVRGLNRKGELADHGHEQVGAQLAAEILARLKVDKTIAKKVVWLVRYHMQVLEAEQGQLLRWLRKRSRDFKDIQEFREALGHWCSLGVADRYAKQVSAEDTLTPMHQLLWQLLVSVPFYAKQLTLSGKEIADQIGAGPQVGHVQQLLLERIQGGQLINEREALLAAVCKWRLRQEKQR